MAFDSIQQPIKIWESTAGITALPNVAKALLDIAGDTKIFAFVAGMGCGKTTFIKHICQQLGVETMVNSPTFGLVNTYKPSRIGTKPIFHFDLYRLAHFTELANIGFEEYLATGGYCLIEWPQIAFPYLLAEGPKNVLYINIDHTEDADVRQFSVAYSPDAFQSE